MVSSPADLSIADQSDGQAGYQRASRTPSTKAEAERQAGTYRWRVDRQAETARQPQEGLLRGERETAKAGSASFLPGSGTLFV
mmetsp:Transcript_31605/g.62494  ORF Transcript_31605/g.62494 Transcript_31605/m.62494 type:complete len:83 (+) Transcript_31605:1004-1252(+)